MSMLCHLVSFIFCILLLQSQCLEAFECPTETDNKCEKFWHQLFKYPGHNLREGLRCLNYTSNITSSQALGNSSSLQHIHFDTISLDITEIDEVKEHIRWRWHYMTSWLDERLKWPEECQLKGKATNDFVKSDLLNHLWNAVDFISDAGGGRKKQDCQNTIQITQGGEIRIDCITAYNLPQKFDFTWYPFDSQMHILPITLEWHFDIWKFTTKPFNSTKVLVSGWNVITEYQPAIDTTCLFPAGGSKVNCTVAFTNYTFMRPLENHFLQTYLPSMMLSYASAASVFIPYKNTPGRMGLCVTTLLSLVTLFNGARSQWTKTSYMRAIDFWVILCYTGMFSALMEYIVILYLSTVSQTDTEEGSQKRIMIANAIERVIKYVLPLYNLMFPIIFFTICPSQGGSNWLL